MADAPTIGHIVGEFVPASGFACSFCGKTEREAKTLIAGPRVFICNECVGLCNDILAEREMTPEWTPPRPVRGRFTTRRRRG